MKKRKILSLIIAGLLTVSLGTTVVFATEAEIADMQAQKQEAEVGLAQTQANISNLESKKQELEYYLADLNAQYEELTNSVAQLSIEAGEKEEQLKVLRKDLKKAKKAADKQYEAMKIRIAYMYEKGGSSALELLLSSGSISEFLNRAENISQISQYDRDMLQKYEELQASIKEQEDAVEEESAKINALMSERSAKQQEVQSMAASTSESISSYISQISASEEEANALMAQISSADNSIAALVAQAEAEEAARQAAWEEEQENYTEEYSENDSYETESDQDMSDSSYSSEDTDIIVEDVPEVENAGDSADESSSENYEGTVENTDSESGGKYLGNFTLTAYCNCAQCCGTAGNLTASGTVPAAGRTVAMAGVPFGTQLMINGNVYTVEDLGTPYGHVDIYFDNHSDALSFGLQYAEVYQVG